MYIYLANRFINSMLKQISLNDSDPLNSKEVEYIKINCALFLNLSILR